MHYSDEMSDGAKLAAAVGLMAAGGLAAWWMGSSSTKTAGGPNQPLAYSGAFDPKWLPIGSTWKVEFEPYKWSPGDPVVSSYTPFVESGFYPPGAVVKVGNIPMRVVVKRTDNWLSPMAIR